MSINETDYDCPPEFVFSQVEIRCVKQIWTELNIIWVSERRSLLRGREKPDKGGDKSSRSELGINEPDTIIKRVSDTGTSIRRDYISGKIADSGPKLGPGQARSTSVYISDPGQARSTSAPRPDPGQARLGFTSAPTTNPGSNLSFIPRSIPESSRPEDITSTLPSLQYNLSNLEEFKHQLCCKLLQLDSTTSNYSNHAFINQSQYLLINTNYQVIHLLQLITIMINYVEYNRPLPTNYLKQISKVNHRIYNLDSTKLLVFGEALVVTIINYLNKTSFNILFTKGLQFEYQIAFNTFISKLFNLLVYYGEEAKLDIPVHVRTSRPDIPVPPVPSSRPSISQSSTKSSTKSSRLSLYVGMDDEISVPIDHEEMKTKRNAVFGKVLSKFEDDDDDDDSYDLLYSFGDEEITTKKSKRSSRFKRSSHSIRPTDSSRRRVSTDIPRNRDNCAIM